MERKTYFRENEDDEVKGFVVIETDDNRGIRVAEKWLPSHKSDRWLTYWITRDKLQDRRSADKCEKVGSVSDDQYERICEKIDDRALEHEKAALA